MARRMHFSLRYIYAAIAAGGCLWLVLLVGVSAIFKLENPPMWPFVLPAIAVGVATFLRLAWIRGDEK